jgi:antiviral defense system Shedu protein SduA
MPTPEAHPIDKQLLARFIAHFSRHTFATFITELFSDPNTFEGVYPLPDVGEGVFYLPYLNSYGGSIHEVAVLHFPLLELFRPSDRLIINDPTLINKLVKIRNIYHRGMGQWGMVDPFLKADDSLKAIKFITNLYGIERKVYEETLVPAYQRLKRYCGIKKPMAFVGSPDSFVDLNPNGTEEAVKKVLHEYNEGIAISASIDDVTVHGFTGERILASGASPGTRSVYEPVVVGQAIANLDILNQFQRLIREESSEARLQDFFAAHYREIFGSKYDQIRTELWLRFPEHDIRNKERRLDIFLRNSIRNDWDLFEIKRPIRLTPTYRDVPVIAAEVSHAILQLRNYARILAQDKVKRYFAKEGIEYFEPSINLVIGRTPQIPEAEWRWVLSESERDMRIFTFDELFAELRSRFEDRYEIFKALLRADPV